MTPLVNTAVCVVGAGPVGLALAIELRTHGVRCIVVEQDERHSVQPRAKLTNVRSMELMRRWGLADRLRDSSPLPPGYPSDIVFVTRIAGWELARFPNALSTAVQADAPYPEPAQQIPQPYVEAVLRARAEELGAELRYGWRLEALEAHGSSTSAVVRSTGGADVRRIMARYIVGADGSRSTLRHLLGISMRGEAALGRNLGIVFNSCDLARRNRHGRAVHYWCVNAEMPSILGPIDGVEQWWLQATDLPDGVALHQLDPAAMIRAAVGAPIDIHIIGSDPWTAHRLLADSYRDGGCFLLGDAAHLHPPMGGYGMNMGIGDAVDLGWKLAAVLDGWANDALLDTYQTERRPIHERVLEESSSNYSLIANDLLRADIERDDAIGAQVRCEVGDVILDRKAKEFRSIGVQLGYRYEGSPIVVADGTPEPPNPVDRFAPTARPGHRLPHAWCRPNVSTLDLCGTVHTLLSVEKDTSVRRFVDAARRHGMPLRTRQIPPPLVDLFEAPTVLVRPDHHVAWRGHAGRADPDEIIDVVRGAGLRAHHKTGVGR